MCACADLFHTGYVFSAEERLSAGVVILMAAGFAPHFEVESFFVTLHLAAVFALTFVM